MKHTKTIIINTCVHCPHYIFDDAEEPRRWGLHWCEKLDKEVPEAEEVILFECPLP